MAIVMIIPEIGLLQNTTYEIPLRTAFIIYKIIC